MPLSDFFSLTINGAPVLQLTDFSYQTTPEIKEGSGRIGSTVTLRAEGYVEGATPSAFQSALALAVAVCNQSGLFVQIIGLGGLAEFTMLPIGFLDGGPHGSVTISDKPQEGLRRELKFLVTGKLAPNQTKVSATRWTRPRGPMACASSREPARSAAKARRTSTPRSPSRS
jgi:hypothetical protein